MSKLKIGLLPVTNKIVVGKLNKTGTIWLSGKQDVTDQAVMAVVSYLKKDRVIYQRGAKTYELKEIEIIKDGV